MGFWVKDSDWKWTKEAHIKICEYLGIVPHFDKRENIATFDKVIRPGAESEYKKDGAIAVTTFFEVFQHFALKYIENEVLVEKMKKQIDEMSGYLASKELQEHLAARLKALEEKFENQKKSG